MSTPVINSGETLFVTTGVGDDAKLRRVRSLCAAVKQIAEDGNTDATQKTKIIELLAETDAFVDLV